eukprot:9016887-Lingulodinium_polyedra.AAC.1
MAPPATPIAGASTGEALTPPPRWAGRRRSGQPSPRPPPCSCSLTLRRLSPTSTGLRSSWRTVRTRQRWRSRSVS